MRTHIIPCLKITAATLLLFGVVYPLLITSIAYLLAPGAGKGELILIGDRVVGFERIGQSFVSDKYFNSRPSAVGYNAAASGGSNKGPANPEYLELVKARIDSFLLHNPGIAKSQIPVDLITASGSGLDPHISVEGALIQVPRISRIRGIPEETLRSLIIQNTEGPLLGLFGPPAIHVLKLNIAIDNWKP